MRLDHCFVGAENTNDISSNSSTGSLVTPARVGDFLTMPVVTSERSVDMIECERCMFAAASRATATNPEINRRFMEKLRWFEMLGWPSFHRITANGHARMWAASPFTILFTTCRAVPLTH